jgi:hypothetical protein
MTFGILDFIDSYGINGAEFPVLQPVVDDVFDRVENPIP